MVYRQLASFSPCKVTKYCTGVERVKRGWSTSGCRFWGTFKTLREIMCVSDSFHSALEKKILTESLSTG